MVSSVWDQALVAKPADKDSRPHCLPSPTALPVPVLPHPPYHGVSKVFLSLWERWRQVCAGAWLGAAGQEAPWAWHLLLRFSVTAPRHEVTLLPPAPLLCTSTHTARAHRHPRLPTQCSQAWHAYWFGVWPCNSLCLCCAFSHLRVLHHLQRTRHPSSLFCQHVLLKITPKFQYRKHKRANEWKREGWKKNKNRYLESKHNYQA